MMLPIWSLGSLMRMVLSWHQYSFLHEHPGKFKFGRHTLPPAVWKTPEMCQKRGHIFGVLVHRKRKPESRNNAGICMYLQECVGMCMYCRYVSVCASMRDIMCLYLYPQISQSIPKSLQVCVGILGICRYKQVFVGICWYCKHVLVFLEQQILCTYNSIFSCCSSRDGT